MRIRTLSLFLLLAVLAALLASCAGQAAPSPVSPAEPVRLRMAIIPVLDALPMFVAQKEGLFAAQGVAVEFIPVGSAPERDQVIAAGQADGMINETVSTLSFNKENVQVQIVRYARTAAADQPLFRILASGKSGITDAAGLKGVEIGISQGTVIEYLTERLLQAEGFTPQDIRTIAAPKISDRMALLGTGELKAAMLPEPLATVAVAQGGVVILDDSAHPNYSYSTLSFRKAVIDQHPAAVGAFLAAWEEAVRLINTSDPAKWNPLLAEQKIVPEALLANFKTPPFAAAGVPTQQQWDDALAWAKEKGLISADLPYAETVNASFLP